MKTIIVILLLCLVSLSAQAQETRPLGFTAWYNLGDRPSLWMAMVCATRRWRAASCLDVDISIAGAHVARWASEEDMPNRTGYVSGATWEAQKLRLLVGMGPDEACQVLTHEIGHVLRRSYGHPCAQYSMCYQTVSISQGKITAEDLGLVCSKHACGCVNPE